MTQLALCLILEKKKSYAAASAQWLPWTLQWKWRPRPSWHRIPQACPLNRRHAQSTRAKDQGRPRRHEEEESFGLTSVHLSHQFGFRDATASVLEMWRLVSGQPTCIEIKGSVRGPDENRSRCCVPCLRRFSPSSSCMEIRRCFWSP